MDIKENLILMGVVLSAQGIKGEIELKSFTSPSDNILNMHLVNQLNQTIILTLVKQNTKGNLICKINEVNNRTEAKKLKGLKLFCYKSNLPLLKDDEFYIENLKKLTVLNPNFDQIGKITNIYNFGAGDIIEIKFANNKKIELFPFNKQFFPTVTKEYIILNKDCINMSIHNRSQ